MHESEVPGSTPEAGAINQTAHPFRVVKLATSVARKVSMRPSDGWYEAYVAEGYMPVSCGYMGETGSSVSCLKRPINVRHHLNLDLDLKMEGSNLTI